MRNNPIKMPLEKQTPGSGFTLIETLVATMILSICVVVVMQLFSGGLKSSKRAGNYTRACFYAREKMETFLLQGAWTDGVLSGEFGDGYTWQSRIERLGPAVDEEAPKPLVNLFKLTIGVSWQEGFRTKSFQISTIAIDGNRS